MMNNGYGHQRDLYASRSDMCFDNKGMVTPTPSERTAPQAVHVNIVENDKNQSDKPRISLGRRIRFPHIANGTITVVVLTLILLMEYGYMPGTKLGFTCGDPQISFKYKGELVSPTVLIVGSLVIPFFALIFTEILAKETCRKMDFKNVAFLYKEFFVGVSLVLALTEVGKVLVGEHRPHFLDVCEPDTAVGCQAGTFVSDFTCTGTRFSSYFIVDSSRSFPSGHSSISVFVGIFSGYLIHKRLVTSRTGALFKPLLVALCLTWSLTCSLSRITDRRHHWWDVLAGMTMGVVGAIYSIRLNRHRISRTEDCLPMVSMSTTTLLDIKNKDATSVII